MKVKNKKVTYFLLVPAVVGIWGSIVFQFIKPSPETPQATTSPLKTKSKIDSTVENYRLALNYRDPFLKSVRYQRQVSVPPKPKVQPQKNEPPKKQPQPKQVHWPAITYSGYIVSDSAKTTALLRVNGIDHILAEGESFLGQYALQKIFSDSVRITQSKEVLVVKK